MTTLRRKFYPARTALFALACAIGFCAPSQAQLETRITTDLLFGPGGKPSVAVGDFNQDGKLDVAAVLVDLQIFLGNGDGTFQPPINYPVGSNPYSVAVADFNGDGKLDLAVANYLSSTVTVLFGNGDGTFETAATLNTEMAPVFIAVGDFNGDHKPDLLVQEEYYVTVFLNNGDGTFGKPINTKTAQGPDAVGLGDFDRDGILDLAVAENTPTSASVDILLGNGDGTFRAGASYPIPTNPYSIAVADFRGDDRLDLAIADFIGAPGVSVLLGNGDGTFGAAVTYTSVAADWVTAGDFNGDGKPDLIVSNLSGNGFSAGSVSILLGNGDGTFQGQMVFPAGNSSNFVAVGDLNGDKKMDVIDLDLFGEVTSMLNTGVAVFSPTSPVTFPAQLTGTTSWPQTATLTNSGTTAMKISSVSCSGRPFRMTRTSCVGSLAPGAQCTFTTNFTAQAEGQVSGTVTFRDSASSKPQVVELVGTGTVVELSPPQLEFPPQKVGTTSAPETIQLTNTGSVILNITHFIFVNGNNYNDFAETNTCGSQLGPGATCTITVTFTPRKTGKRSAFVRIEDDGGGSPQEPKLLGTGD